ncbi:MAG: methyl-accepting chemotaxis protein [Gammaproteobacteria bacterium]|nr:methyl-accepting chemotaxis protein [Gammaproteobacteria bacterium]
MAILKRSLTQQFTIILVLGLLLLGAAGIYGFAVLSNILETYDHALHRQVVNERQILIIQNDFKKQVQEWKNVLLRGHQTKDLNKYWGKFEKKERSIREKITQLLPHLSNQESEQLLNAFLESHQIMGKAYREGLEKFKAADFDPKVGDKVVRGIDRAPTEQLADAAALISQEVISHTEELHEQSQAIMLLTTILSVIAITVFSVLGGLLVKRQIIRPTQEISTCLRRFAEGDFTAAKLNNYGGELGEVASSAGHVKEHLGQIMQNVRQVAQELSAASGALTSATHNTQANLTRQQDDIQQVAAAMDQMSTVVSQVSGNTSTAADAAEQASKATHDGSDVVRQSVADIGNLAKGVEDASQVIKQLESDVSNIGTVLDVIRSIAEQTNLLALNAAIEAARAGEQGRGFAVVADEVRTLAGRTQESTSEIQEMIEKLEQGTTKAVSVMQESQAQAIRSVEQSSGAGEALESIAEEVNSILEMNKQIAMSAREQATVTEEIHKNITNINSLSKHTADQAHEMSASGESVSRLAQQMDQLVNRFKV